MSLALSSCETMIAVHEKKMSFHRQRSVEHEKKHAVHEGRVDAITRCKKNLERTVDRERKRTKIVEEMIAAEEEFKGKKDEARKQLALLEHFDEES